jgi:hypothetical protein
MKIGSSNVLAAHRWSGILNGLSVVRAARLGPQVSGDALHWGSCDGKNRYAPKSSDFAAEPPARTPYP